MRSIQFLGFALVASLALNAHAQTIKTDPVLSNPLDLISIKTDPVLLPSVGPGGVEVNLSSKGAAGVSLRFSSDQDLSGFSLNFQPVLELVAVLSKYGAKVEFSTVERLGMTTLHIKVNGQSLTPIAVECENCGAALD